MSQMIDIQHLNKYYGDVHAVNDLSFSVEKGELFAFLGLNGAGKSTTISIMCGFITKDSGKVYIDGHSIDTDMDDVRRRIGVVYQDSLMDRVLTVKDNLSCRAAMYGIVGKDFEERLAELSEKLDFSTLLGRPLCKLSGGQRRRIDVARALLHDPELLILDEPTTGLDPQTRKMLWNFLNELRERKQITILLTTHYMEEAAEADRVIILDNGSIAASGTPLSLKNEYAGDSIKLYGVSADVVKSLGLPYTVFRDHVRITVDHTADALPLMQAHPEIFVDFEITKGGMDDVFLAVTGKKLTGGEES